MVNRANLEPAFILHTRSFKETSLIVDAFTENFGKISFVAKGAKRPKSSLRVIQTPSSVFSISFVGKSDLKNLTHCEIIDHFRLSSKVAFSCIIYLNELLTKTLEKEDPHPEIFQQLKSLYYNLSKEQNQEAIELQLRSFELILLQELLSFAKGDLISTSSRNASKQIMRRALDFQLGNKTLNIRKYLIENEAKQ